MQAAAPIRAPARDAAMHSPRPSMSVHPSESRPSLVLIADDQEWMSRSLESVLQPSGFAVLRAFTGRQCLTLAESTTPDAILVNLHLPDMDGCDLLRQLQTLPTAAETPRIATTWEAPSRAQRLRALEAGAWAVYAHPVDAEMVLHQIRTFVRAHRAHGALMDSGLLDPESGLYNARGLARRAREAGAEAQRRRQPLACVAFAPEVSGLDDGVIEQVLERLVEIVNRSGRGSDIIGRLGRTEFAAVLPATEAEGAVRLLERLQAALGLDAARAEPAAEQSTSPRPRLRAGYAAVADYGAAAADAVELVLRAAAAMRHASGTTSSGFAIRSFDEIPSTFRH